MDEEKKKTDSVIEPDFTEEDVQIDRQLAVMCHILGLITGIFTPLIFCLTKRDDAFFLNHHETEALNFQITIIILMAIAVSLDVFVVKDMFLIPVVVIIDLVLSVTAAFKANEDLYYKYPISIPFLKVKKPKMEDEA